MKTQLWRSDPQSYMWHRRLQSRLDDVDTGRHVNNVTVKALHAEAWARVQVEPVAA